jgi:hypothetical protein
MGTDSASPEASDLVEPPLNLGQYIHLRIFAYTSNTLIASFEYMDWMLVSGTWKNFRFLMRSCLFTERAPVIKLICSTWKNVLTWLSWPPFSRQSCLLRTRVLEDYINHNVMNMQVITCCSWRKCLLGYVSPCASKKKKILPRSVPFKQLSERWKKSIFFPSNRIRIHWLE